MKLLISYLKGEECDKVPPVIKCKTFILNVVKGLIYFRLHLNRKLFLILNRFDHSRECVSLNIMGLRHFLSHITDALACQACR
jgi:hypothetical protein